jgi:hypothetical protein
MRKLHSNQSGLVSIVVSMLLIMVLSLIVLAFARLTQREQRQVLDRQLNTEAFYAAESGINDGTRALLEGGPARDEEDDDCDPPAGNVGSYSNQIDGTNIIYSCLLIDPSPPSLEFDSIDRSDSKVFPVDLRDGSSSTNRMTIFWQAPGAAFDRSGCPGAAPNSFPPIWPNNCSAGILRIEIMPIPKGGPFNGNNLLTDAAIIFAVPDNNAAGGSTTIGAATGFGNQGKVVASGCKATTPAQPKQCEIEITGLNLTGDNSGTRYWVRLVPLYKNASVTVCAPRCNGNPRELKDAQAQIDSTGRAADVLRRIQVRVGTSEIRGNPTPLGAIEANNGVCKRLQVAPPATATDECGPI